MENILTIAPLDNLDAETEQWYLVAVDATGAAWWFGAFYSFEDAVEYVIHDEDLAMVVYPIEDL